MNEDDYTELLSNAALSYYDTIYPGKQVSEKEFAWLMNAIDEILQTHPNEFKKIIRRFKRFFKPFGGQLDYETSLSGDSIGNALAGGTPVLVYGDYFVNGSAMSYIDAGFLMADKKALILPAFPDEESAREAQYYGDDVLSPDEIATQKKTVHAGMVEHEKEWYPTTLFVQKAIPKGVKLPVLELS